MADTGNGAMIVFQTTGVSFAVTSFTLEEFQRQALKTSHLGTTSAHSYMPEDLFDPPQLNINIQLDPNVQPPYTGAAETIRVLFPTPSGGSTGAKMAGTGFVVSFGNITVPEGQLMTATIGVKYTGAPTWTASS